MTQAAAAGTRAQEQFDELREEFRRRASEGFTDEMQQMRQAARELDEKEGACSLKIKDEASSADGPDADPSRTEAAGREKIEEELSAAAAQRSPSFRSRCSERSKGRPRPSRSSPSGCTRTARNARDTEVDRALQVVRAGDSPGLRRRRPADRIDCESGDRKAPAGDREGGRRRPRR